jgi:hypothetical protein
MKIVFPVIAISFLFSLSGCFTASPDDSRMPHAKPANWEYSLPGGFDRGGFNR